MKDNNDIAIAVSNISKQYIIKLDETRPVKGLGRLVPHWLNPKASPSESRHWALRDVNFTVKSGERVGVIGSNGAGKSTLLKIMSRVTYPSEGEIRIRGILTSLLEVGTGFNDNLSGRENIYLNASLYGMSINDINRKFSQIVEFSEINRFIDTPIKHYSSGMRMRLAFSIAAHIDPDILLLDEVLAVGDLSFQQKCLERVEELTGNGRTLLLVSHSMDSIIRYCTRCIWLESGRIIADGDSQEIVSKYVEKVLKVKSETNLKSLSQDSITDEHKTTEHVVTAKLLSAQVIDVDHNNKTLFSVNEKIGVKFNYEITGDGVFLPAIHLYCPQGTFLFAATVPDVDITLFRNKGTTHVQATVWLPQDLFNIGSYSMSLIVFSPFEAPFRRYFCHERILSFHCVEAPIHVKSARGTMPRGFPGPIRPMLDWLIETNKLYE